MIIYGIRFASPGSPAASSANSPNSVPNKIPAVTLVALDLAGNQISSTQEVQSQTVEAVQEATPQPTQAVLTTPTERITGFTAEDEHRFVVSMVTTTSRGYFSHLLFLDRQSAKVKKVSGFKASTHTIEGLVALPLGSAQNYELLSVFSFNGGVPPFDLGKIDPQTGKVQFGAEAKLPEPLQNQRLSNLARARDGTVYATVLSGEGTRSESVTPTLVRLNLTEPSLVTGRGTITPVAQLQINNQWLQSDLLGLAVAPSGQLYALANPNYEETNSLFTVDTSSGEMKFLRKFQVDKITFTHS